MENQTQLKQALANTIYGFRRTKALKREYLAEILGVTKSAIDKYEQGINSPRFLDIYAICKSLEILPTEFFTKFELELTRLSGKV